MKTQKISADSIKILSTEEVLERLKIGRSKLFELKKSGKFIPGRHYFQNGRVLRIIWSSDLLQAIHEDPIPQSDKSKKPESSDAIKTAAPGKSQINFEYH